MGTEKTRNKVTSKYITKQTALAKHGDMGFCRIGRFFGYRITPYKKNDKPCVCLVCGQKSCDKSPLNSASNEDQLRT